MLSDRSFLQTLAAFIILSVVFIGIERLLGPRLGGGRKQPVLRKDWLHDGVYFFVTALLTKPLTKYLLLFPAVILIAIKAVPREVFSAGMYRGFGPLSQQPLWLQVIEIYLLSDLIAYWTHRLFHTGKWWPFHAVHHSTEELDWLGSVRVHPVNEFVNKLLQVSPLLLLGFNPVVAASVAPALTFFAIFLHANVNWDFGPLRWVIASPVFHRWHHSKDREAWDKNFAGLFPIWDIFFGTYFMPKGRYPENFGIHEPMPSGYLSQLWAPFAWLMNRK
jgi:sterol desaturase/sphingolipid hydroxylase (fatty acid hydroxylase superfamily)